MRTKLQFQITGMQKRIENNLATQSKLAEELPFLQARKAELEAELLVAPQDPQIPSL